MTTTEKLFNLLKYNNEEINGKIILNNIELESATMEATLYFSLEKPVQPNQFKDFVDFMDEHYLPNVRSQKLVFKIESFDEEDVIKYYRYVIQKMSVESPKLVSSLNYTISYKDGILNITVPSQDSQFTLAKKTIINEYHKIGMDLDVSFNIIKNEEDIGAKIKQEIKELIDSKMKESYSKQEFTYLNPSKELNGNPLKLSEIPDNEEDFITFKNEQRGWNFIINGYVVFVDEESLEKKSVVKFIVYDGESYVYCTKRRLSSKEEARYFKRVSVGMTVYVQVYPDLNTFTKEVTMRIVNMKYSNEKKPITFRTDDEPKKRVELHLHTKMSALDGVPAMEDYIGAAKIFGHNAIAITDHNSVQSFHELHEYTGKHPDFKAIYGLEVPFIDEDRIAIAYNPSEILLEDASFVVFDFETTGFSVNYERIIEVSATRVKNGIITGEFSSLVNPEKNIPPQVVALTGITNKDVEFARSRREVLTEFKEFCEGSILVAHNAEFDISHLYKNLDDLNIEHPIYPVIDTLILAKVLNPGHKKYTLDALCKRYAVVLEKHHRASDDARATEEVFLHMLEETKKLGVRYHSELNSIIDKKEAFKYPIPGHINLIAKTQKGLTNLYHMLSIAGTDYCTSEPVLTKAVLEKCRDGILVGSGCRNSHFFDIAFRKDVKELEEIIDFYDYIEVQPQNSFEYYKNHMDNHVFCYRDTIKKIISLAKKHNVPVVATGDCHQINKEDLLYREILVHTDPVGGERFHYLKREKEIPAEYYMTTREMLDEFHFLGDQLAYEIVVDNTNMIADACDVVKSFSNTPYPPADDFMKERGIPSAEEYVKETVYEKAKKMYGDPLPDPVSKRIEGELSSIIENKFSTIYLISQQLVYKSRSDGYVVGSRGSVGSSFVAHLMDITEVNSLPPHYRCPNCHFWAFKVDPEEKDNFKPRKEEIDLQKELEKVASGYDLPDKNCPVCGTLLERDGHDIPFETFLGVPEDPKTPDIDLNFSGENQRQIHNHIRVLFGETKAFRAGTILTCKDKTAYAVVRDYFDEMNELRAKEGLPPEIHNKAEIEALSYQINGAKKTSSQHPGGIVVVPQDHEIYEVTPVQYPGDSKDRSWMTTHFDYHTFEKNLFKLDVLGHDDPTVIRYLMRFVQEKPEEFPFKDAMDIPVNDSKVYQMMNDTTVLGIKPEDIDSPVATFGISEFGTGFVRGLLEEARPHTFAELVKVSGLSHGTDVWNDNAQALLEGKAQGMPKLPFKDVIGCRDDIMINLISYGVPAKLAFNTMEFVRKGKPSKDEEKWAKIVEDLRHYNVPEWYIWSCTRIKYMFPKAHATAYVIMALRIAWFKVYRPIYFYSAILSKKMTQYDVEVMVGGVSSIRNELDRLKALPQQERKAKEDDLITTLELALEMTVRGMKFLNIDLYKSGALDFTVSEDETALYIPFKAIDSMGEIAAQSIVDARNERPFSTQQDFLERTRISKTLFKRMDDLGAFKGLPETNQMSLDLGI